MFCHIMISLWESQDVFWIGFTSDWGFHEIPCGFDRIPWGLRWSHQTWQVACWLGFHVVLTCSVVGLMGYHGTIIELALGCSGGFPDVFDNQRVVSDRGKLSP